MDGRKWLVGAAAAALLGMPAFAEDDPRMEREEEEKAIIEEGEPAREEVTRAEMKQERERQREKVMRGATVLLGGGIEGYTGDLSPQLNPGPAWGARVALKPSTIWGVELAYSGAVNEIDNGRGEGLGPGATDGADLVRNGGEAVATLALSPTRVHPYLLGGVGIDRYSARGGQDEGFSDDTAGHIPLGGGVRAHWGSFTADARLGYSLLFSQQFASNVAERDVLGLNSTSGGRYMGSLNFGAAF